jgi:hypothetical protein
MVPLKLFVSKALGDEARRQGKRQMSEMEGYAQPCQTCQAGAKGGRDGACQIIGVELEVSEDTCAGTDHAGEGAVVGRCPRSR